MSAQTHPATTTRAPTHPTTLTHPAKMLALLTDEQVCGVCGRPSCVADKSDLFFWRTPTSSFAHETCAARMRKITDPIAETARVALGYDEQAWTWHYSKWH